MANEFEAWAPTTLPAFLLGKWGNLWGAVHGFMHDALLSGMKQATESWFVAVAPADSMPLHAQSRHIEPLDGESLEALRARLLTAWDHWGTSNDELGLQNLLKAYTGATDLLVQTPAVDGFALDNTAYAGASRLWVLVGNAGTLPWGQPVVGAGLVVGSTTLVGVTMTPSELARIRRIVKRYKPGHMLGAELIIAFTSAASAAMGADQLIRIPLSWQMVGYSSSEMTVGPALFVGQEYR